MSLTQIMPFISTVVILAFAAMVFRRYFVARTPAFLFWGLGLAMFAIASFAEAYLALAWSPWAFFAWYLFGAALNAAWIGHGTLYLLAQKPWVHAVTALLVFGSLLAAYLMSQAMPTLDEGAFAPGLPISEQYGTKVLQPGETAPAGRETGVVTYRGEQVTVVRGLLPLGTPVRLATPFFNIYGVTLLVGGALWSAYLLRKKQGPANRVQGNLLIAAGALLVASASTLARFGIGQYLYLGELLAAVLMFAGFLLAGRKPK